MKKILVVDDAGTVRMYHKDILKEIGYEVDEAVNGVEAIEKALQTDYDLFIVDINMPKLDGYGFVNQLRVSEAKQSPVIMVSTESEQKDIDRSIVVGANFYIIKPVKPDRLKKVARLLLGDELC